MNSPERQESFRSPVRARPLRATHPQSNRNSTDFEEILHDVESTYRRNRSCAARSVLRDHRPDVGIHFRQHRRERHDVGFQRRRRGCRRSATGSSSTGASGSASGSAGTSVETNDKCKDLIGAQRETCLRDARSGAGAGASTGGSTSGSMGGSTGSSTSGGMSGGSTSSPTPAPAPTTPSTPSSTEKSK